MIAMENGQERGKVNAIAVMALFMIVIATLAEFWDKIRVIIYYVDNDLTYRFLWSIKSSPYFHVNWCAFFYYDFYNYVVPIILIFLIFNECKNISRNKKIYYILPVMLGIIITIYSIYLETLLYSKPRIDLFWYLVSTTKMVMIFGVLSFTILSIIRLIQKHRMDIHTLKKYNS